MTADKIMTLIQAVSCQDTEQRRERLDQLEQELMKQEQAEVPVEHWFCGDIYARKIVIPANAIMTGRIHKFDHFDVMLSGDITVSSDNGTVRRLKGFNLFEGRAGKKRAGFAHEETHWITFHSAPEQPIDTVSDYITCANFDEYHEFCSQLEAIQKITATPDRQDFYQMTQDIGVSPERIQQQVDQKNIDTSLPGFESDFKIDFSSIDGFGVFTKCKRKAGDILGLSLLDGKRTELGRYVNHSHKPNCFYSVFENKFYLVAMSSIAAGCELTVDYRQAHSLCLAYCQ